ncbi:MAG TPA: signal peptidase II [Streptosporangiaceae bacterium]|jgi:signal peptidase II
MGVLIAVAVTALTLDVISKVTVVAQLEHREPIRLVGGLLMLTVSRNSGAAFSIGTGMTLVFTVIAVGVIVAILRTARRLRSLPWAISLGLLLGGATGNLIDRIVRSPAPLQGHVVDWIELPHWPVFNLADSSIVCGGALAVLLAARGLQIDGTRIPSRHAAATEKRAPQPPDIPDGAERPAQPPDAVDEPERVPRPQDVGDREKRGAQPPPAADGEKRAQHQGDAELDDVRPAGAPPAPDAEPGSKT